MNTLQTTYALFNTTSIKKLHRYCWFLN